MSMLKCLLWGILFASVVTANFVDDLAGEIAGGIGNGNFFESCYERCYQIIDGTSYERYRPAFKEFYSMGEEARRLKNMRSVNGTLFLIDSTLDDWHDSSINPNLNPEDQGLNIWQFQKDLASIIAFHLDSESVKNPIAISQFNSESAWNCDHHTCLDCCTTVEILQSEKRLITIEMDENSDKDANIEPACRMGYKNLNEPDLSLSCTAQICNEFAIAFLNSDFDHNVHAKGYWDDYSPCDEHFDTRLAVGTHAVDYHELKRWSSRDAHPIYIKDTMYTMEAARALVDCMNTRCCQGSAPQGQSLFCAKSADDYGENPLPFYEHTELDPV